MSRKTALENGLLLCSCGHPGNNHFNHKNACARCHCANYREVGRQGMGLETFELQQHSSACLSVGGGPSDDDCICGAEEYNQRVLGKT
jgi:hypothetical protein